MAKMRLKNFNFKFITLFILFFCLFCSFSTLNICFADNKNVVYSNVLDDLCKDESFNEADFPIVEDDYSLKVIQIAESSNNELFVYVYQPCGDLKEISASSINISVGIDESLNFVNYKLNLLNSSGVFFKYLVVDFKLKSDKLRYYEISSILRPYNENLDARVPDEYIIDEVSFDVGQQWSVISLNGQTFYECNNVETVTITDKFVGFVRYNNSSAWFASGACDSHFVAFSTSFNIDDLIEVDVYYQSTPICAEWVLLQNDWHYFKTDYYGVPRDCYTFVRKGDVSTNEPSWFFGQKFLRERIQTVEEFLSQDHVSDECKNSLSGKQWVLRFCETEYSISNRLYYWTNVDKVEILRLKFNKDGVSYNLGVVDNKQSGGDKPVNDGFNNSHISPWFRILLTVSFWVLLFAILIPFLPVLGQVIVWLFKAIFYIFKYVLIALWFLITLPFKIFKKDK